MCVCGRVFLYAPGAPEIPGNRISGIGFPQQGWFGLVLWPHDTVDGPQGRSWTLIVFSPSYAGAKRILSNVSLASSPSEKNCEDPIWTMKLRKTMAWLYCFAPFQDATMPEATRSEPLWSLETPNLPPATPSNYT